MQFNCRNINKLNSDNQSIPGNFLPFCLQGRNGCLPEVVAVGNIIPIEMHKINSLSVKTGNGPTAPRAIDESPVFV